MTETLWLAGMLFANLWGAGSAIPDLPDGGAAIADAVPILTRIPYVSRLFRQVGYDANGNLRSSDSDKVDEQPASSRTPILPPIKHGEKATCDVPPTQQEILAALPTLTRGIPYVYEQYREEVEFTVERLVDRVDDARWFPLIGPAQLHHCHWKCTVYYTDVVETTHPFPFKARTKHEEIVYIDKDHLHLCVDQKDNSGAETSEPPQTCPGGHFRPVPRSVVKAEPVQQVLMEVTVVSIDRAAVPDATYRWAQKQLGLTGDHVGFGVCKNKDAAIDLVYALRNDGFAKMLAEPRVVTLSGVGVWTYFNPAGEKPVTTPTPVSFKQFGINLFPVVSADGKIHLEIRPELETAGCGISVPGATIPNLDMKSAKFSGVIESGQTLVIGGLTHTETTETDGGVPVLSELPGVAALFGWKQQQQTERDLLILVTARVVVPGDASETCEPPLSVPNAGPAPFPTVASKPQHRVAPPDFLMLELSPRNNSNSMANIGGEHLVRPDGTVSLGAFGSVYVAGMTPDQIKNTLEAHVGKYIKTPFAVEVSVSAYNSRRVYVIVDGGTDGQQVTVFPFDGQTVLDVIGGIDSVKAGNLKKAWVARPASNRAENVMTLPVDWKAITQDGQTATNYALSAGDRVYVSLEPVKASRAAPSQTMSIDDVVKMSKAGVSQKIILRQMELTNAVFNLTADDIVSLHEQGVSKRIISAMQERRTSATADNGSVVGGLFGGLVGASIGSDQDRTEAKNASPVVTEVTAFWYDQIHFVDDAVNKGKQLPGLVGRIYLYSDEAMRMTEANGCLHVEMYDKISGAKLSEWRFDAESLKSLKKTDVVGMGYTLFLLWEGYRPEITQVELRVLYMPENGGQPHHAEPQVIRLKTSARPTALDFGFPILREPGDRTQIFSFWSGLFR